MIPVERSSFEFTCLISGFSICRLATVGCVEEKPLRLDYMCHHRFENYVITMVDDNFNKIIKYLQYLIQTMFSKEKDFIHYLPVLPLKFHGTFSLITAHSKIKSIRGNSSSIYLAPRFIIFPCDGFSPYPV